MNPAKCYTAANDEQGHSSIIEVYTSENLIPYPDFPCLQLNNLFYTEDVPQSDATRHNNADYDINLPTGAMRILRMRMPTKQELICDMTKAGQAIPEDWTKFNYHRTDSVDYLYILSGAITYVVGDEQIELKQGDFLAQLAAGHTWINDHDEPCEVLCVMQGIKPTGNAVKMVVE